MMPLLSSQSVKHWVGDRSALFRKYALTAVAFCCVMVFYIYSYNSGWGFDALEYLAIGRSLVDGYALYAFIPSKSWGLYAFIAAAFRLGVPTSHAGVSALITGLFAASVASTWYVARRLFGTRIAWTSIVLVGLCAAFMELNFLEPEPFVYLFGLAAYYVLLSNNTEVSKSPSRFFWAAFLVACGCAFKVVAGFYILAIGVFAVYRAGLSRRRFDVTIRAAAATSLGFICGFAPQLMYFTLTGRTHQFLEWTITYPLLHYPRSTDFLLKFVTKLLWFLVLTLASVTITLRGRLRQKFLADERVLLAVAMGIAGWLSLFKNQATHYAFPGAAFLCFFISWVAWTTLDHNKITARQIAAVSGCLIGLIGFAALLYSPRIVKRFTSWRDFADERVLRSEVQSFVKFRQNFLAINDSAQMYWISERYPPVPVLNTEAQTTWWLSKNPRAFADAVGNSRLTLIEFNPNAVYLDDPNAYANGTWKLALGDLRDALSRSFCQTAPPDAQGHLFWVRKDGQLGARFCKHRN